MVWYSHLFQNFPQFIVIHTVKGFGIIKKAEIDVFLELSCFSDDPVDVGNLISGSSAFSVCFQGKPFNITVIQVYSPIMNAKEAEVQQFYDDLQDLLKLTPKNNALFIIGHKNAKVGSQEIPGVTSKLHLAIQNEAGKRLTEFLPREHTGHSKEFYQQTALVVAKPSSNNTRDDSTHDISRRSIPKPD